ncbi:MAG: bifunctional oligoribonuclease/PAP phosphatase NrnA [Bacteroidetes bacterium]|nr:bifunctional oligoribonuclease/PAP phosphatase NrnA [Bacteroidota bacterium]
MRKDSPETFKELLQNVQNIAIITHWNPDGDAIGSSLGLFHYLKKLDKNASVIVPNSYPEFLQWLPNTHEIVNFQNHEEKASEILTKADVIFTLDFNSYKRLEKLGDILENAKVPKVLIDHHQQPDDYPTYYFHDVEACSTCELVFDFIEGLGDKELIDKKIAACLYTGLMTDTGSFRYPNVNYRTHFIVSELLKTNIKPSDIHSAVYDNYSLKRLKLLGYTLSKKLKIINGYPVAYFTLSEEELQRFDYQKGDTEGIVNYPFSIKGIKVCALFNESEGIIKISFRSKGTIDVNTFARTYFNGGGHINAAGGKSTDTLAQTEAKFVELIKTLF